METPRDSSAGDGALAISVESPLAEDLTLIFQRHWAEMQADTPPESMHAMPRGTLVSPEIAFFVMRVDGQPVAMGALKRLDADHSEIKSMHVMAEHRGRGLSRVLLDHLIRHARQQGMSRVSLETGAQPSFSAARALYEMAGFVQCPPFGSYSEDPHSVYMTAGL